MRRLLFTTLLIACRGSSSEPAPIWVGEHIEIYSEIETQTLCAGSLLHLDRYVERIVEFLHEELPADFRVSVQIVETLPCRAEARACYRREDRTVYMDSFENQADDIFGTLRHEITHAIVHQIWGPTIAFFGEGIAEGMARSDEPTGVPSPAVPVGEMLDMTGSDLIEVEGYAKAARFCRFLIDTYGVARFKRMVQETQTRTQDEIRARFMAVYGKSFDEIEAEYLSGDPRCFFQFDICDPSTAVQVSEAWSSTFAVSCEDPGFVGAIGDETEDSESVMTMTFTLDIAQAGPYFVQGSGPVKLVRCGPCDEQFEQMVWGSGATLDLEQGFYSVSVTARADASSVYSLRVEADPDG